MEFATSKNPAPPTRVSPPTRPEARVAGDAREFGTRLEDLEWIDTFVRRVRPFVRVRTEDCVLIKVPVETYPLNRTAAQLLERALGGEGIRDIALAFGARERPERISQIHALFCDVRDLLSGRLGDGAGRRGTSVSRFEGGFTRYPVLSEVAVTYRCDQACRFCYAGCGDEGRGVSPSRAGRIGETTTDEALRIVDRIALDAKVPSVSFTGGEPTLRDDLPAMIDRACARGLRVNLITNGVNCAAPAFVRRLKEAGLASAQVSLEGPDASLHDALTRRKGAFDRALDGIRALRDAGLRVHTNTTVCAENVERLTGIADLAASLGLDRLSMNMIIPTGSPSRGPDRSLRLRYREIGEPILRARDHAERLGLSFHWYSPVPFCLFNPVAHGLGNKGCAACDGLLHVSPTGEVLPCSSFERGVGNLFEDDFESIWFGRRAQRYKRKRMAHPLCRACEHFALCQGACVLYWRAMGFGELYRANLARWREWAVRLKPRRRPRPAAAH